MQQQSSQLPKLNQALVASLYKFNDIQSALAMNLAQQQIDAINICVEGSIKHLQNLSDAKKPQEVFILQPNLAEDINKKLTNNAQVCLEMMVDFKTQVTELSQENLKIISEFNPFLQANGTAA